MFEREYKVSGASVAPLLCCAQSLKPWATGKKYFVCGKMLSLGSNVNVEDLRREGPKVF